MARKTANRADPNETEAEKKKREAAEALQKLGAAALIAALVAVILVVLVFLAPGMVVVALLTLPFRLFGLHFNQLFLVVLAALISGGILFYLWNRSKDIKDAALAFVLIGGPIVAVVGGLSIFFNVQWASDFYSIFFSSEHKPAEVAESSIPQPAKPIITPDPPGGVIKYSPEEASLSGRLEVRRYRNQVDGKAYEFMTLILSRPVRIAAGTGTYQLDVSPVEMVTVMGSDEAFSQFENDVGKVVVLRGKVTGLYRAFEPRVVRFEVVGKVGYSHERTENSERTIGDGQDLLDAPARELEPASGEETGQAVRAASMESGTEGATADPVPVPVTDPTARLAPSRPRTPAEVAWESGDWDGAYALYSRDAEKEQPEAQVRIGRIYYDGLGRVPDFSLAEQWFRKAAAKGSAEARYRLALLYSDGRKGAPWDLAVAHRFLVEAADSHADAAAKLGKFYWRGIGVGEDHVLARSWYQRAARLGSQEAVDWLKANP